MTQERVSLERIPQRVSDLVAGRATWEGIQAGASARS
jgi:hypothetical protein